MRLHIGEPLQGFGGQLGDETSRQLIAVGAAMRDDVEPSRITRLKIAKDPVGNDIRHLDKPRGLRVEE
jgi:hypothetical protein